MNKILSVAFMVIGLLCAEMAFGMPTDKELSQARSLVNELMNPLVKDFNARKKTAVAVGDAALGLVADSETKAAKLVLLRGCVYYYVLGKAYDKAASAIESIMELVPDMPPNALYEITSKAAARLTDKSAPRLIALNNLAKKRMNIATMMKDVERNIRAKPSDVKLKRIHAELTAAMGNWEGALAEFIRIGGEAGKMAVADRDGSISSAELADFWWNYKPEAVEAGEAMRQRAAMHYRKALDAGELQGLKKHLAEKRIAEASSTIDVKLPPQQPANSPTPGYKFNYRVDDKGNAILCRKGDAPCVDPKPEGTLVLPESIDGHMITEFDGQVFSGCDKMTRIVLPKCIEKLSQGWHRADDTAGNAFVGCPALLSIEIAKANPKYTSENGVLYSKDKKLLVAYPKARKNVTLESETRTIGAVAFKGCQFATAKLPEGIVCVLDVAFRDCNNLEVVEFPKTVQSMGHFPFWDCPKLRSVVFAGDAPNVSRDLFDRAANGISVKVKKWSRGWAGPGTTTLPKRWPCNVKKQDSRPISYIE